MNDPQQKFACNILNSLTAFPVQVPGVTPDGMPVPNKRQTHTLGNLETTVHLTACFSAVGEKSKQCKSWQLGEPEVE